MASTTPLRPAATCAGSDLAAPTTIGLLFRTSRAVPSPHSLARLVASIDNDPLPCRFVPLVLDDAMLVARGEPLPPVATFPGAITLHGDAILTDDAGFHAFCADTFDDVIDHAYLADEPTAGGADQ